MFASLKHQSAATIRNRLPRTQLGIENLEDRAVPAALLSDLGLAADGPSLLGGLRGGVVLRAETAIVRSAHGGMQGDNFATIAGGAMGGVTADGSAARVSVFAGSLDADGDGQIDLFHTARGSKGEEIPLRAHVSVFDGSLDADGANGFELALGEETPALVDLLSITRGSGEEIPQ